MGRCRGARDGIGWDGMGWWECGWGETRGEARGEVRAWVGGLEEMVDGRW